MKVTSLPNRVIENPIYIEQTKIKENTGHSRSPSLSVNKLPMIPLVSHRSHGTPAPRNEPRPPDMFKFTTQELHPGAAGKRAVGLRLKCLLVHLYFQVMVQKHNRKMSMSLYIASLAVTDSVALVVGMFELQTRFRQSSTFRIYYLEMCL